MIHWQELVGRYDLTEDELLQIPADNVTNFHTSISLYKKKGWDPSLLLEGTGLALDDFNNNSRWLTPRQTEIIARNFYLKSPVFYSHKYSYYHGLELENIKSVLRTIIKYTPFEILMKKAWKVTEKNDNSFHYEIKNIGLNGYSLKITPKPFKFKTMVGDETHASKGYLDVVHKIKKIKMLNDKSLCYSADLIGIINFFYKDHGFDIKEDKIYLNGQLFAETKSPLLIPSIISLDRWGDKVRVFEIMIDYNFNDELIFEKGEVYNAPFCFYTWEVKRLSLVFQSLHQRIRFFKSKNISELDNQIEQNNIKSKELLQLTAIIKEEKKNREQFLANIVHEIKSPLASIVMLIDSIEDHVKDTPDFVKDGFCQLGDKSGKLINFVDNVMSYFSMDNQSFKLRLEPLDLAFLLNDVLDNFSHISNSKDIKIVSMVMPDRFFVNGDYYRLLQVFLNIINNSVKFTDKGSIFIDATYKNNMIEVSIKDTGIGIDRDKLSDIFNMFKVIQKKQIDNRNGIGLGLYISKTIIELHNGNIFVESEVGKGSTFKIRLPFIEP